MTGQQASADPNTATTVVLFAGPTEEAARAYEVRTSLAGSGSEEVTAIARLTLDGTETLAGGGELSSDADGLALEMTGDDADDIQAGDMLRLTLAGGEVVLFPVTATQSLGEDGSPPEPVAALRAANLLVLPGQPMPAESLPALAQIDRLRFDQLLWLDSLRLPAIEDVAFNGGHPRYWGEVALAESSLLRSVRADNAGVEAGEMARLYRQLQSERRSEPGQASGIPTERSGDLTAQALAGLLAPVDDTLSGLTWLPVGMLPIISDADAIGPNEEELGADGLESFASGLFVDPVLVPNPAIQPRSGSGLEADAFNRYYVQNRRLRGIHSLLFLPEVSLIAVPDAVHRPWTDEIAPPDVTPPAPPTAPLDWADFLSCRADEDEQEGAAEVPPPVEQTAGLPLLQSAASYDSQTLLDVQHALVNICQARRDLVTVLALPGHFEKRQCIEWQEALRQRLGLPRQRSAFTGVSDFVDLSYVSVYHPWLVVADDAVTGDAPVLRVVPPDGAICGTIAARERQRQVWVAPANVPLQGVLDLTPVFATDDWADLFEDQFNLIRREPRDFRAMSAHTLSEERQLLQLSVRRLMILLRKVAMERGMVWTFENNDERLRDGVRATLEALLRFMFERGAFAGRTPQEAFRVVTDGSVNTRQSIDQGRFIAQIQVAPSEPMEFITVLLSRASDGVLLVAEA